MGAETAILTGLAIAGQHNAQRQKRKHQSREAARKDALLDSQLSERKQAIQDERDRKTAYLRARYGASGVRTNSRSAQNLLRALNQSAEDEINYLETNRHLKVPTSSPTNEFGNFLSVLNSLQRATG